MTINRANQRLTRQHLSSTRSKRAPPCDLCKDKRTKENPTDDLQLLMSCQQFSTLGGGTVEERAANVSRVGPVIPRVAFCLVSDSLRKGNNLIIGAEESQTAGMAPRERIKQTQHTCISANR